MNQLNHTQTHTTHRNVTASNKTLSHNIHMEQVPQHVLYRAQQTSVWRASLRSARLCGSDAPPRPGSTSSRHGVPDIKTPQGRTERGNGSAERKKIMAAKRMRTACIYWGPILTRVHLLVVHPRCCQRKCSPDATLYNEIYDVSIKFLF